MLGFHQVVSQPARQDPDWIEPAGESPTLSRPARLLGVAAALASVIAIAWLDALVPNEIALVLLYLVPVAACGWWLGGRATALVATAAAVGFLVSDLVSRAPPSLSISLWHGFTAHVVFLGLGISMARVRVARDHLAAANRRLSEHLERESTLARTDPRTGLPNVRAFLDHLRTEVARRRRDGRPMSVAYLDIDNFKLVNDIYGHAAGDELLGRIGEGIRDSVRAGDVFARVGGDEFAVAFAETAGTDVLAIAQRLAARIRSVGSFYSLARADCSIGIASFEVTPDDPELILHSADAAMYEAKQKGKGRIVVNEEPAVEEVPLEVTTRIRVSRPPADAQAPAEVAPADPATVDEPQAAPPIPALGGQGAN
jgi:diguanylate cyclase (GGDEF)-like protein